VSASVVATSSSIMHQTFMHTHTHTHSVLVRNLLRVVWFKTQKQQHSHMHAVLLLLLLVVHARMHASTDKAICNNATGMCSVCHMFKKIRNNGKTLPLLLSSIMKRMNSNEKACSIITFYSMWCLVSYKASLRTGHCKWVLVLWCSSMIYIHTYIHTHTYKSHFNGALTVRVTNIDTKNMASEQKQQ
jgi:cytochrome c553